MARQIEVDPANRRAHNTIAEAVEAAPPGSTIDIAPGIYSGTIVVDKPVHLRAEPGTVTAEARSAFTLHARGGGLGSSVTGVRFVGWDDHATVKVDGGGVRFVTCGFDSAKVDVVWVAEGGAAELVDCQIASGSGPGLAVHGSSLSLQGCSISTPGATSLTASDSQISLERCDFADMATNAMNLQKGVSGSVSDCTVRNSQSSDFPAIWAGEDCDVAFTRCELTGLRGTAFNFANKVRATVSSCTLTDVGMYGVALFSGAIVTVENLRATGVARAGLQVEGASRLVVRGAQVAGSPNSALVLMKGAVAEVSGLRVRDVSQATIAVLGGQLDLTESTATHATGNVVKITDGGACRAVDFTVDVGEVDWPLFNVFAGCQLSLTRCRIEGGAESSVSHAGSSLSLTDTTIANSGGIGLNALGAQVRVERCRFTAVTRAIEVHEGCRMSVVGCRIDGGDTGLEVRGGAIVRVEDTTIERTRKRGVALTKAKLVLTGSSITDSGGAGIEVGDEASLEVRDLRISGCAGVGLTSSAPLELDPDAITFEANAKGNLQWPGRNARRADHSVEELMAELDALVGLVGVKTKIRSLLNLIQLRRREAELGRTTQPVTLHAVFTGPPGTGKTTVARLYGELLHAMGLLDSGRISEVTRADLVVGFIGQTATNTRAKVNEALGGVLFIDEAYALAQAGGSHTDFGEEAINELVPLMENHRHEIAVIVAGYTDEMVTFLDKNPGLKGRFAVTIEFPSYTNDELTEIFDRSVAAQQRTTTPDAHAAVRTHFEALPRTREFANGREVRRLLDAVVEAIANRVAESGDFSEESLSTIHPSDVKAALPTL